MDDDPMSIQVAARTVSDFLGGPHQVRSGWHFDFGDHLASAWGGTYGGATAAACVALARRIAPGRSPRSLHVQMMRRVSAGVVLAHAEPLHEGRTVTTAQVQIMDERDRLAVQAQVTLVDPVGLVRDEMHVTAPTVRVLKRRRTDDHPYGANPVAAVLGLSGTHWQCTNDVPRSITGIASYATEGRAPWRDVTTTGPELACLMADVCSGAAIVHGLGDGAEHRYAFPNTDLSLRFSALPGDARMTGTGSLRCVHDGTAISDVRVQTSAGQLACGLSGSILAPLAHNPGREGGTHVST